MIIPNLGENLGKTNFLSPKLSYLYEKTRFKAPIHQGNNDMNMIQTQMPLCVKSYYPEIILAGLFHRLVKLVERMNENFCRNGEFLRMGHCK